MSTVQQTLVLTGRSVRHWRAQPGAFLVTLLFPVLVVLMMGGLFGGAIAGSTADYLPFVVPGVLAMTMLFGLETTMMAMTTDAARSVTDRFRSMPVSPLAIPAGRCLADLCAAVLGLAVMAAAGLLLGWRWDDAAGAAAALALLLWLMTREPVVPAVSGPDAGPAQTQPASLPRRRVTVAPAAQPTQSGQET